MAVLSRNEVAEVLREIAVLLELRGENPFKARAYTSGARTLESFEGDFQMLVQEGRLSELPGFGEALVEKVTELAMTGRLAYHQQLKGSFPPGLLRLLEVPGLGPRKVRHLHEALGVASLSDLEAVCASGKVAELDGFGAKTQTKILEGIRNLEAYSRRHLWWAAREISIPLKEGLASLPGVLACETAGSLRRGLETVGDLDFLVACEDSGPVMTWFTQQQSVIEVTGQGPTKSSVRLVGGLGADLRVVPRAQFASALHHFTGSKEHNVLMRQRALSRGLSLSEWGLTSVSDSTVAPSPPDDEAALFGCLGLPWIAPELREGLGEIEAAERGDLPRLISAADIRGAFHNHTRASDGQDTLEAMVAAADSLGWEYLGIADHSKSSVQARGLDADRLLRQVEEIRRINASGLHRCRLLSGTECDILPDGSLDFPDSVLKELDYVVASVHSAFGQSEEEMTARILRAVEQPAVSMLGHLTGRLLLSREPYRISLEPILKACSERGVIIELNAHPKRLDLDWRHWKRAAAQGVLCSINPDAHAASDLAYVHAGINSARKGWLRASDVLNTRKLEDLWPLLRRQGRRPE